MNGKENCISRRSFLEAAPVVAAAGAGLVSGEALSQAAPKSTKRVTLGRTGMVVSNFLGDRMADVGMYEMALNAGVNYWHKMGGWADPAPYEMFRKLDRDSFYCDQVIGTLEKDRAIQLFEQSLTRSGLEMIDGFKIHSRYRVPEDIKNNTGIFEAFEELKKQGKTRFLMLSQHINTAEILEAAIDSDMFDLIQVPVNPTVPTDYFSREEITHKATQEDYLALIKKAHEKGIAITAMKVFLYGPKFWDETPGLRESVAKYLPDDKSLAKALVHWTLNVPGVQAFGNLLSTFDELRENIEAANGALTAREELGIKALAKACDPHICRMCGACEKANPDGIAVSDILRFSGYYASSPLQAKELYRTIPLSKRKIRGSMESYSKACPYKLDVGKLVAKAQSKLA